MDNNLGGTDPLLPNQFSSKPPNIHLRRTSKMDAKAGAKENCAAMRDDLINLSHRIHSHPELGYEEEKASAWLCEFLADEGFSIEREACGMPTAFIARRGDGPLHVAICAEYDALPGIGH